MTSKRSLTLKPSILTASILFIAVLTVLSAARPAQAQTETVLYNFTGGSDGAHPQSRLTADGKGNFYGTTYQGGTSGSGTVFELSPNGTGGWNETVLHSFNGGLNIGPDGAGPSGPVIFDRVGNLYGTTRFAARITSTVVTALCSNLVLREQAGQKPSRSANVHKGMVSLQ